MNERHVNISSVGDPKSYDLMMGLVALIVVIVLLNVCFFYWCWYTPLSERSSSSSTGLSPTNSLRNDLYYLGHTQLDSADDARTDLTDIDNNRPLFSNREDNVDTESDTPMPQEVYIHDGIDRNEMEDVDMNGET